MVGRKGPVEVDTELRRLDMTLPVGASPNFLPSGRKEKEPRTLGWWLEVDFYDHKMSSKLIFIFKSSKLSFIFKSHMNFAFYFI